MKRVVFAAMILAISAPGAYAQVQTGNGTAQIQTGGSQTQTGGSQIQTGGSQTVTGAGGGSAIVGGTRYPHQVPSVALGLSTPYCGNGVGANAATGVFSLGFLWNRHDEDCLTIQAADRWLAMQNPGMAAALLMTLPRAVTAAQLLHERPAPAIQPVEQSPVVRMEPIGPSGWVPDPKPRVRRRPACRC